MAHAAYDHASVAARTRAEPAPRGIASFPRALDTNPYQRLLYGELRRHGFVLVDGARLKLGWLVRNRKRVSILHFHWPEAYYRRDGGLPLAWAKLALFSLRLSAAKALGYRIVWTIHQVAPHERSRSGVDRVATRGLARRADVLLAHDERTAADAAGTLGARRVRIVAHGSYVGVYPEGASRGEVRQRLGLGDDTVAFLCFGSLRGYKQLGELLSAFRAADLPDAALVVAGPVGDPAAAAAAEEAAREDDRIKPLLGFVRDEEVAELFGACDVAVVARADGGTSGSLILAMSLGLPVVAANAYRELADGCGWLFHPSRRDSLACALERAAKASDRGERAASALDHARSLRWDDIGDEVAAALGEGSRQ
jgi:glycosyltransferase involved in cell wall biosynthesis